MSARELISTIVYGMVVGLIITGLVYVLNKFIFVPVLCRPDLAADCSQAPVYSTIVAYVIGAFIGIIGLARIRIYRPLLVVIAASIALWGSYAIVDGLVWYWTALALALLFGLGYGAFAWVARLRSFLLALVITVVLVVAVRLMLNA
jgi:hypothetical protein